MKKRIIYLSLLIVAIATTVSYHFIQTKWLDFRKAETYFERTQYSKAVEYYLKALKKDLDPYYFMKKLVVAVVATGIYEPIEEVYEKCLEEDPDNEDVVEGFSSFLSNFDQFDKAIRILKNYLKNHPDDYYMRLQIARAYAWRDDFDKAIKEYQEVLSNEIHDLRIEEYDILLEYARLLVYAKDLPLAIKTYKELMKIKSRDWCVHIELVNVYLEQKNYNKAFEVLKEIPFVELDEQTELYLADLYAYNKNYKEAAKLYKDYLQKHPKNRSVRIRYNKMLIWTKNYDLAMEVLDKIKYVYSADEEVLEALAKDLLLAKEYDSSIRVYKHLIKQAKDINPQILVDVGNLYIEIDNKNEAVKYFQEAYDLDTKDEDVKRRLALTLSWVDNYERAFPLLRDLYEEDPYNQDVGLSLVNAYLDRKDIANAKKLIEQLMSRFPDSANVLMICANFQVSLGHAKIANNIYKKLLKTTGFRANVLLSYADTMNTWGDFDKSERIYKKYLKDKPNDIETRFKLAWVFTSMTRYEEALEIYNQLLFERINMERCYLQLAKIKLIQRENKLALKYANKAYVLSPDDESILMLIKCLVANKKIDETIEYFNVIEDDKYKKEAYIVIGKAYLKKHKDIAQEFFQEGLNLYPDDIKLYFYANLLKRRDNDFQKELIKRAKTPSELNDIAWFYVTERLKDEALIFFEKAIQRDKNFYPAKLGLAQTLAMNNMPSVDKFDELLKIFPRNYLLLLWKARALGWTRKFSKSLEVYSILEEMDPKDPVIIIEMARVASWDKKVDLSMRIYDRAFHPSVDSKLYKNIVTDIDDIYDVEFQKDLKYLKNAPIFFGYEKIKENIDKYSISKEQKKTLEGILIDHSAQFEIQKAIYLEQRAKYLLYQMHYIQANEVYKDLVAFSPYNQEALYDYGQTFCYLNLCDKSREVYEVIVDNYSHNRAEIALERNIIKSDPFWRVHHRFFEEAGRGDIDRMRRNRTDVSFGIPIHCRYKFIITPHRWVEKPTYAKDSQIKDKDERQGKTYNAYGYSLDFMGPFSKYVSIDAGFRQKFYANRFHTTTLGHLNFMFNLRDLAKLSLGFDRDNEIDNIFSLENDIQSNILSVEMKSLIKRTFAIEALSQSMIFSDDNFIQLLRLNLGVRLTRFPKVLRLKARGEYRNSDKLNDFVFEGPFIINIIHPYWTPKKYKAYAFELNWYHDISKLQYCGTEKRYYELMISSGSDTEKNPFVRFEGGLYFEFKKRWFFSISGGIHKSKIWDSDFIRGECKYHF